jgi:hypothetical protein
MSHQEKIQYYIDILLTAVGVSTGAASTLDNVEQIGRIMLLGVSIISGVFLILVNWKKATDQLKKMFNK